MHEMALVRTVLDEVLKICEDKPIAEVCTVHLTIGEMHDVVDAYVPGLFRYLARGTICENAEIVITRVPVRMRCNECGRVFEVDLHALSMKELQAIACPHCGAVRKYRMVSGREFRIENIEVAQRVGA